MKKFTFAALIVFPLILLITSTVADAQGILRNDNNKTKTAAPTQPEKCGTMEWLNGAFQRYPGYRQQFEANERRLNDFVKQKIEEYRNNPSARTQSTIYIPVVFHVVLNAAGQAAITDAMIQAQLDTLNHDFAGLNGDSTNIPAEFQAVRGHGNIQFCLAQRTPLDLPTNGIVRVTSNTISSGPGGSDPVKSTAAGGSDTWDATRFLNIWVCNLPGGLLGYATFPPGAPSGSPLGEQGVVVLAQSLPGGTAAPYNKGRTLTHEAGHFFNLYHIWGDATCGNDLVDDTPQQSNATFGCPSGTLSSGCAASPTPPGRMYQNFMDYTDDACMTMFSIGQNVRSEASITLFRASLLTSNGCTAPPPAAGNDSRISAIITPANGLSTACTSVTPIVTIQNLGSNTLTSATINVRVNGGSPITSNWTGSLVQGASQNVTLASLPLPTVGAYTIKVHTTLPNGQVDAVPSNDTATAAISRVSQAALPLSHDFETVFLPPGWGLDNPNGDETWGWYGPGAGGAGGATAINNYDFDFRGLGRNDDIISRVVSTTGLLATDSILVNFDLAHKNFPSAGFSDTLRVLVSNNCGATYTTIWQRIGAELATAGSSTGFYGTPVAGDWRNQRASVGQNIFSAGQIQVAFRNSNGYGNVVWLDNINISLKPRKDLAAQAIVRPNLTECGPFAPSLTVRNNGGETITAFKTGYTVNNGAPVIQTHNITLAPGASTTVTFANLTLATGTNIVRLFCAEPISANPGVDTEPANDTLTRSVLVPPVFNNLTEGFEGTTFPPANWLRLNPNNDAITWVRASPGRNSGFSAFIDNWTFNTFGRFDMLQTPGINTTNADSLIISFDVAHRPYPGAFDRLRVLVSNNCGTSFTSVYSKDGSTLATGAATTANFINPTAAEWRRERVSVGGPVLGASALIHFENLSDWGNNIFIDNINIVPRFKRDLQVLDVSPLVYCNSPIAPVATVFNNGTEAVTSYSISYTIGTGTPVVTTVNTALAPGATANVTLTSATAAIATNSIRVYTHAPVGASGTGDQYLVNDTITKQISVVSTVTAESFSEGFEGASFPPTGWGVSNPDVSQTWQRAGTGRESNASASVRNFIYTPIDKQVDRLFSPVLSYTGVDSVKLTFDVSAAARVYSGIAGNTQVDTLTVMFTRDCGNSFTTIYKKWGVDLQTLPINANYPQTTEFTPGSLNLWRSVSIDLTAQGAPNGPLQVVFQNTANNGNNVYIDNVNLSTRTLPSNLRSDGYVIFPNPFRDIFTVWHWQQPTDLRFIAVYNSSGQMVWRKEFGANAGKQVEVDLSKNAAGTYIVRMGYTSGKADVEVKVVKY